MLAVSASFFTDAAEPESPTASDGAPLKYSIVVTGGELLEGVYPDAHTGFLTRALRLLGCQCVSSMIVDDNREEIQRALRYAADRSPLVIVTGGLGPTPNDITRETLSEFTGIPLAEHPEALAEMARRMKQSADQLRANLRRQCLVPGKSYLPNTNGTAVGLIFDAKPALIIALPGPPRELQPMVQQALVPYLEQRFGVRHFGSAWTLRFVGAGQSLIDQTIKDHVKVAPDVIITSLFEGGRVDFTFSLPGNAVADRQRLQSLADSIREHLSEFIYADDGSSLEETLVQRLQKRRESLSLVELGTGGAVHAALQAAPGGPDVLSGAYVASTTGGLGKLMQLSNNSLTGNEEEELQALGNAAAARTLGSWVLVTGPLQTEPGGAFVLPVACRSPGGSWTIQKLPWRSPGEIARTSLVTPVLDLFRKRLQ